MACSNYKEFTVNHCPDAFVIQTLEATTTYAWEFKGKFNQVYRGSNDTDADGLLTIPVDTEANDLTKDLFQPFSGAWELRAWSVDEDGNELPVVFCTSYDFLVVDFAKVTPLPEPNDVALDLDCPEIPEA